MATALKMPQLGMTMTEAKLVRWLKREGEEVRKSEPVAEIETDKLNAEVNRILTDGSIKKTLEAQGMAPSGGAPARFVQRVKKEYDGWVKVVRETQLKME